MKKFLIAAAIAVSATTATAVPAHAGKDGESGYIIGCMIGKYLLGLENMCMELHPR